MSSISARMRFLITYAQIPPEAWDFIIPHGPVFSKGMMEYMVAGVVRDISKEMENRDLAEKVYQAGSKMVEYAAGNLINGWQEGDDICPLWPRFPFPFPFPIPFPEPDPYPWYTSRFAELNPQPLPPSQIGSALKVLAGITSLPEVAEQLKDVGSQLGQFHR